MHILNLARNQLLQNSKPLIFVIVAAAILLGSLVWVSYSTGISVKTFTRDPASLGDMPYYSGYFSQLGGVFWIICSTIALFTASILNTIYKKFLMFSGFFTLFLGLDDLFMLHDGMLGQAGVSENIFYGMYMILSILYISLFYKTILHTPFVFLGITFACLAMATLADMIKIPGIHPYIFEDGFKMTGIISWLVYHFLVSKQLLSARNAQVAEPVFRRVLIRKQKVQVNI